MKNVMHLQKIFSSFKNIFPETFFWIKLPAFCGWCALSLGIAAAHGFLPEAADPSWIVYHKVFLATMALLGLTTLFSSSRTLRLACFFCFGFLLYQRALSEQYTVFSEWKKSLSPVKHCMLSGRVASAPSLIKGKYSFVLAADSLFAPGRRGVLKGKNIICFSLKEPPVCGPIVLAGRYSPPKPCPNPGGFDPYLYSMANNTWGTFFGDSIVRSSPGSSLVSRLSRTVRRSVTTSLASVKNEEYRGILLAAFLNDQGELTSSMKDLFFKAGIYHLLALSGFNIAILAGAVLAFLFFVPLKKEWKILISLAVIWAYLLFIGFIPSLFRSVIMATVVSASFLVQRKNYLLNALGIAGIVWLWLSPLSLFTPSYQLSFAATFGLITLSPLLLKAFPAPPLNPIAKTAVSSIFSLAAVSLASFIATLPVLMYHFNQLYIFGIFANLFCVTLMSISMWAALAGFMLQPLIPVIGALCMRAAEGMVFIMVQGAGLVRFVPWTALQPTLPYLLPYVLYVVFLLGAVLVKKDFRRRYVLIALPCFCMAACLCLLAHGRDRSAQAISFSIKNSFLAAVRWPDHRVWIFGSGPETPSYSTYRRTVLPWLQKTGPGKIEAVIFPGFPGNAVQFLGPLLQNEPIKRILSMDSNCVGDENLRSFLKASPVSMGLLKDHDILVPTPGCTCHVYSQPKTPTGHWTSFGIKIYNSVVFLSDKTVGRQDSLGSTTITIRPSKPLRFERAISEFHPLFAH
jgi:ComEC/Rec2-related protein